MRLRSLVPVVLALLLALTGCVSATKDQARLEKWLADQRFGTAGPVEIGREDSNPNDLDVHATVTVGRLGVDLLERAAKSLDGQH